MKKMIIMFSITVLAIPGAISQGYNVGDNASDFKLKNVDGKFVSLSDYPDAKGFTVIFTCNHCPYAKAYEDRIIALDKKYKELGYPVIAINPNDPEINPEDSYDKMIVRSKEKGFTFPYLFDETQEIYRNYGAKKTPHVYLIRKKGNDLVVEYIGAIDDNYQDASKVTTPYVANAIDALLAGKSPDPDFTKAIGCSIKDKSVQ
ncbi:MAG: thioredoxin family protein [Bacteroidales bacterium]|jgi:peroxiredoxin|nr:thioredoxin family protein [Bacteroidales bacterium]